MEKNNNEKSEVALREEEILAFWREHTIFDKSVETPAGEVPAHDFVFYDGPPFATGTPHYGHILAGTIKDAIPRFWTMNGYRVKRIWGWDCHGLPIENIIEKRLGLATKRDIEAMGVKQFNEAARSAVLEYADYWKEVVPRIGRFVDMDNDYRTMDASYTESVWWVFSELNKKGLVYEGFKSMHLCPRCETTLSNFEVNQGYKDVKDIAVTVKMPLLDDAGQETDTSILIWTTTPWTLPGNFAVAVNTAITYVKTRMSLDGKDEYLILAKERLSQLDTTEYEVVEEMTGDALLGKSYQPPFDTFTKQDFTGKEKAWKIYHAEYVSIENGTGAVHIAPAYGEDDLNLAKQENIPIMHHVGEDGRFKEFVDVLAGQLVKPKDDDSAGVLHLDTDIEIVKYLKDKGTLIKKENITHSYPHCWRCDTPLLNYATTSWFVRVTDIKDKLVEENAKVKWVPEHVGTNRFGKWLEGARDWAVSRQRYWGAPIPVWKNPQKGTYKIFGSLKDMQEYVPKSGNTYFLIRHGESEYNTRGMLNAKRDIKNNLTEKGRSQVRTSSITLADKNIDIIYYSPLERTKETAFIVAQTLGIPDASLICDERISEVVFGAFECRHVTEYHAFFGNKGINRFTMTPPGGGESWIDIKKRVSDFLYEIEKKHAGKRILIVSHNGIIQTLQAVAHGFDDRTFAESIEHNEFDFGNAEMREMPFVPMPHNDKYELDFHRPYIDEIVLYDTDGTQMVRIPDVFDCWFESGSMPYGEKHYMGTPQNDFDPITGKGYPAQFIAEGLDQTRGWFYSMLVLGTALFGKSPFENVIVNGLALAEDGKKMSKSLQNYPDPVELVNRIGADTLRMYLLSSPIVRAEDLSVVEKDILSLQRKNIGRLHNVLAMYEMYADGTSVRDDSSHILDKWIIARLNETVRDITSAYKAYELDKATRPLEGLIDDISVWYLRRSRDRLKSSDDADKRLALSTLRFVLKNLAQLMAPVMPFYAEYLFLRMREKNDVESVHLTAWPKGGEVDPVVLGEMSIVRELVTTALEARTKVNIKVRQPLASLTVNIELEPAYAEIVCEEINVKQVIANMSQTERAVLDIVITSELKQEGDVRELMRAIQDTRKRMGLIPHDRIVLSVNNAMQERIRGFEADMLSVCGVDDINLGDETTEEVSLDGVAYIFGVVKV